MKKIVSLLENNTFLMRFHAIMTFFWVALITPTLLFWPDSILFLALISLWANIASHWAAYQASHAEEMEQSGLDNEDLDAKLDKILELLEQRETAKSEGLTK